MYFPCLLPLTPFFIHELKNCPEKLAKQDYFVLSLLGFPGITLFSIGLFYGIRLSTAINGALLTNTQPISARDFKS